MAKSGNRDFKWNISQSEGKKLAYDSIKQILIESKNNLLELNELIVLINKRTKHIVIKNYTKRRNLINYLKVNYGSFINFLDNYDIKIKEQNLNDLLKCPNFIFHRKFIIDFNFPKVVLLVS